MTKELICGNGTKFVAVRNDDGNYTVSYYEYFQSCGWHKTGESELWSEDLVNEVFNNK